MATTLSQFFATPSLVLFDGKAAMKQRNSTDIVLFSPALMSAICKIAWPLVNGIQVPPQHMRAFLLEQKLCWPCFCAMLDDEGHQGKSARILSWPGQGTFVFCREYPHRRCQFIRFSVNLSVLYDTSTYFAEYTPMRQDPGDRQTDTPLSCYLLAGDECTTVGFFTDAIYAPNYLGEPGEQRGGILLGDCTNHISEYYIPDIGEPLSTKLPIRFRPQEVQADLSGSEADPSDSTLSLDAKAAIVIRHVVEGVGMDKKILRNWVQACQNSRCLTTFTNASRYSLGAKAFATLRLLAKHDPIATFASSGDIVYK
ncbi:hypothetical protein K438DRAFT_1762354 [Mycena galopus ATCC 62051]|nr:hypothetical protein K438DRAFT_1762354 [Mycena galopus ATCC 62051]